MVSVCVQGHGWFLQLLVFDVLLWLHLFVWVSLSALLQLDWLVSCSCNLSQSVLASHSIGIVCLCTFAPSLASTVSCVVVWSRAPWVEVRSEVCEFVIVSLLRILVDSFPCIRIFTHTA